MQSRVYEKVECPSVRLCHRSTAAGLLLSAWRTGDMDPLLHGAPAAGAAAQRSAVKAGSVTLTADVES